MVIVVKKGGPGSGHFGHEGRPGKVGGSAPSSRVASPARVPTFYPSIGPSAVVAEGEGPYPPARHTISQFMDRNVTLQEFASAEGNEPLWRDASMESRAEWKAYIVESISDESGVDEEIVNKVIKQWAWSSNDEDMRSLSLQKAASEELGIEMSGWQLSNYIDVLEEWETIQADAERETADLYHKLWDQRMQFRDEGISNKLTESSLDEIYEVAREQVWDEMRGKYSPNLIPLTSRENERKIIRAMYNQTQAELSKAGFHPDDTILLWRGVGHQNIGGHVEFADYKGNAIESWSIAYTVGRDFRKGRGDIIGANVPVRNIISTCKTGFGCITEGEVITVGTVPGMQVTVIDPYEQTLMREVETGGLTEETFRRLLAEHQNKEYKQDYQDSVMIALPVDNAEVRRLWKELGSDEDILPLHITMLYLGKMDELDKESIVTKLTLFTNNQSPIEGEYGGAAIFNDNGDGYPIVLLYDSPQLPFAFAKLAGLLKGLRPDLLRGFTPHTTLSYTDKPVELSIDIIPHRFDNILLRWGDEDILYPLKGDIIEKGGEGSGHHGHLGRAGKVGGSLPRGSLPQISSDKKDVELSRQLAQECRAQPKECYKNSVMALVRVKGGKYVEGYFVIDMEGFQFPIEHGWIDKEGTIIDITLPDDTGVYIPANSWTFDEALSRVSESGDESLLPFSNYYDENWRKAAIEAWDMLGVKIEKGGPGSGHHDHAGRPGKVGGSAPSGGKKRVVSSKPKAKDTMERYRNEDGTWTKERAALHDKIINSFFEGKTPVDEPTSYVLGGGAAAGKSTLVRERYAHLPKNMVLANADEIKEMLPEYGDDVTDAAFVHEESSYISKKIAYMAASNSYNVIMDGTGDGEIWQLEKKVASMRPLGQPVIGIYVTVDINSAIERSMRRAKRTGRYVPESVIRYSHHMVAKVYPDIIAGDLYDSVNLYDASTRTPKLIAEEVGKSFNILDKEAYQRFLERGK
jgi:predicted ABC-type ATPase/2'-5' RNA ligase